MRYPDEAKQIWQSQVPRRGQGDTVQGELLRAVEKLRDEACRNGNQNWREGHQRLLAYLRLHLTSTGSLAQDEAATVAASLDRLADYAHPETDDAIYDRIADGVVLWARANPDPVAHPHDPKLKI